MRIRNKRNSLLFFLTYANKYSSVKLFRPFKRNQGETMSSSIDIQKAVILLRAKKRLREVALEFGVTFSTLYSALRRNGYTVAHIRRVEMVEGYTKPQELPKGAVAEPQALPQPKQLMKKSCKKKTTADPRFAEICSSLKQGKNMQDVAKDLHISRERVRQILDSHGTSISDFKEERYYYGISSEHMRDKELSAKRHAFIAGMSIAEYRAMRAKIGRNRFARLQYIAETCEKNKRVLKNFKGEQIFEMSIAELFKVFFEAAKQMYPDKSPTEALDTILVINSGYQLTRENVKLPFIKGNVRITTKSEFGHIASKNWGLLSPTNPLYRGQRKEVDS